MLASWINVYTESVGQNEKGMLYGAERLSPTFPKELKAGDMTSLFKQEDIFSKKNYD